MEEYHESYTEAELAIVDVILKEIKDGEECLEIAYQESYQSTEPTTNHPVYPTASPTPLHYVGGLACHGAPRPYLSGSGDLEAEMEEYLEENFSSLAPLQDASLLKIPSKANRTIQRYVSRADLKTIHPDIDVARELCLILLNNLSTTFHTGRWKRLYSGIMRRQVSFSEDDTYVKIIRLLYKGTIKHGRLLLVNHSYEPGKSKSFALPDRYYAKGIVTYKLTTEYAIKLRNREHYRLLADAVDNPIARNLLRFYSEIRPPMKEEIHAEAKALISKNFRSKKGKKLTYLNRHDRSRWKDHGKRMFVEDCMDIYETYTDGGFLVPVVTGAKAGGRVVDSFALMPGWIRAMITVNGERLVEVDYVALHPNLAATIFGGHAKYITHRGIAEKTGFDLAEVKVEHLSFFNKRWDDLRKSPLYDFYVETDIDMMTELYLDKLMNGHKSTSRKLFALEVELMTMVITQLNSEGIYVLYIYDAVMCEPRHKDRVVAVMNSSAVEMGVYTTAK